MRCPNCQTINPPKAKFCLECGNRLVVCPNCGTVNLPVAKFCIECGSSLQTPALSSSPVSERVDTQPLSELLPSPQERRVVTVMFADITGSTPLADRLDPEDMRAILTGYFNLMTEQIRKHGGTVEKYIGDAVMAVFGIPVTHEDDPNRAIRAALDMQVALAQFNELRLEHDAQATRLQMRIGINTGEVVAPGSSEPQRQDFLITGDAVNIAARLQQVATPDTILVGERTYFATRDMFEFRALAPLHLKGKPEPISARVVLGLKEHTPIIAQHPRGFNGRQVPLIGRTLELMLLHASYARVQAERHPHLITILGAPGVGKSRLVREFIAREQELIKSASSKDTPAPPLVLQGHCPPYGESITYWPLIEILRSLLDVQDNENIQDLRQRLTAFMREKLTRSRRAEPPEELVDTILPRTSKAPADKTFVAEKRGYRDTSKRDHQFTATPPVGLKQSGAQGTILRAWRILLEMLGEEQSLIVVVDDLQWADEALLDLLEYLTDRINDVPVLFLCPARPDFFERRRNWGSGQRNFTTIELEALSREESSELVDALLNTNDLPEALRYTILTRAEGNPFFVEEIVRMFIDQGILVCEEDHEHGAECWRIGRHNNTLFGDLATPMDQPEDTLINRHYLIPLPHVPDTIQGVLAARVDLLSSTEKFILQHAAIIGRTFWLSTLLELASDSNTEAVQQALESLIRREYVVETDKQIRSPLESDQTFSFKHVLIRDVVYNNIPRQRRSKEHARLAVWLEKNTSTKRDAFIELLAYHYQQALASWSIGIAIDTIAIRHNHDEETTPTLLTRPLLRQKAIYYLTLVGDQAMHNYYTLHAIQVYSDAFDLLLDSNADALALSRMHEKLGDAYAQRGNMDEAWQEYRKALRLATTADVEIENAELLILYARPALLATRWLSSFDSLPDAQEVQSYIDAGLKLLEGKPVSRELVAFLTYQAFWYMRQLETATNTRKAELAEQALDSGLKALQLAEELNDPTTLSPAMDAMGFIYTQYHRYNDNHEIQQRRQKLEALLTDREELYDLYVSLGNAHEQIADYPTAIMWFGRAWSSAQTMESPAMLLTSMVGRMRAWREWNHWDDAIQVALDILQLIEKYQQDEKRQFWALETLATIAYRRGEQEEGDQYARQCKRLIDQQIERSDTSEQALLSTKMHAINLAREDWTHAAADYRVKLQTSEPLPSPRVLANLAELFVMTGENRDIQAEICERAISVSEQSGDRKSLAIAFRARGRMYLGQGHWALANDDLRQSLRRCEVLDLPWERGNTLYYLGTLYKHRAASPETGKASRRNADLSRARYHFEQALGFFESLKATPSVYRVREALLQDIIARV